ncbi:MAG TPA: hypothetical protein RMH85_22920 [Polyangiaceae bacterium LLY-WYZ-15_(1-7)]|nr:hypothetical protein [Sandaracinus sp.]HJK92428.1 hypothetical protein [Polyangiaceae bacterium LLY-WYZ-15_(1-7)]MBJ71559.1 hypothetical protein [Sandaracinus sp.]HJL01950.1 hypothetical protein [Polyangiaceae bacterium LLY-WYZ-15_(1-7)]HJL11346.1 hypothetical protein [Polyangiaceae bacterium LLY-WYZ-15_(1-7)]
MSIDADIAELRTPSLVRGAGALVSLAGMLTLLTGLQVLLTMRFRSPAFGAVPWAELAGGLVLLYLGTAVYRARFGAALATLGLGALFGIGGFVWAFLLVGMGLVSLVAFAAPALLLCACLATLVGLRDLRRIDAARRRLAEQGLAFGV